MGENVVRGSFHFHYHLIAFKLKPNQTKALPRAKEATFGVKAVQESQNGTVQSIPFYYSFWTKTRTYD
jgi:hypothetical protein